MVAHAAVRVRATHRRVQMACLAGCQEAAASAATLCIDDCATVTKATGCLRLGARAYEMCVPKLCGLTILKKKTFGCEL